MTNTEIILDGIVYIKKENIISCTHELGEELIGKYVIVRCHDAGVHVGYLVGFKDRMCLLKNARRLWRWKTTDGQRTLSSIAINGAHDDSKISCEIPLLLLTENCEIMLCTDNSAISIKNKKIENKDD